MPPGPTGLPIVGYRPFLGSKPHITIANLSEKYGNVFTIKLGIHNMVILNDLAAVKDAFSKEEMLSKPKESAFTIVGGKSFADDSGSVWQEHRRFSLQVLRDLGFGKNSMEVKITDEIQYLIEAIDKNGKKPLNIDAILTPSISNNISQLVFGHRFDYDNPERTLLDESIKASPLFSMVGVFSLCPPWLGKLIFKLGTFHASKAFKAVDYLFENEVLTHKKNIDENDKQDYINGYLVEMNKRKLNDPNTSFTTNQLLANSKGFFGAGSETVRTTTEWALLLSAYYVEHQKRIQEEIDSVIGNERSATYADRNQMPFTHAFINEIYRWVTILPLNLIRKAETDTTILGHFIPKDTPIMANIWAVHNDPNVWVNPRVFNPNRFLTKDGKQLIKTEALIPFSYGKRSCVGETLGRVEVFLYFVSLLQRYAISAPIGKSLSLEDSFGLSLQPKHPLILTFTKRS